jgi:formylglycine-generating enzyme required for sulfatase activity
MCRGRTLILAAIGLALASSCRSPTDITVEVTADFACADLRGVAVTIGGILGDDLENKGATTTSSSCDQGNVGRVVVIPSGSKDDGIAIKVVAGFGRPVEECAPPYPKGCIVARRSLKYTPHQELHVPITLRAACDGIACGTTESCVKGACLPAALDGSKCAGAGCDESTLGAGPSNEGCAGTKGRPMVRVDAAKGAFCIDSTETTNADYALFLNDKGANVAGQPPECAWNDTFVPRSAWPAAPGRERRPVGFVDWCDAAAYCAWAGKRLCGKLGGGPNPFESPAGASEWFYACSRGGTRAFPYGATYDASACNGAESPTASDIVDVGTLERCEGGFDGIFDMSGNVEEWEASCDGATGAHDPCHRRGGSSKDGEGDKFMRCDRPYTPESERSVGDHDVGIRCCANAQ